MTYSIVARDPDTGQLGAAVQTCNFGVGSIVTWALAGVGAVATQAMGEPAYGQRCLESMAGGASAEEALDRARDADPASFLRQVGVVDASGRATAFTGDFAFDHAGQKVGDGWSVQANMMATPDVWPAMAAAYESASGPFGARLLTALRAAEAAGGDARGRMSAAMLIVDGERQAEPWQGKLVDIRVDHVVDDPLAELERLYHAALAYGSFNRAVETMLNGDAATSLTLAASGLAELPGDVNLRFLQAGARLAAGDADRGTAELQSLLRDQPSFEVVIRCFHARGLVNLPAGVDIEAVIGTSNP
jgi:uncharacterized Ntn-hydrolase superfamily protein